LKIGWNRVWQVRQSASTPERRAKGSSKEKECYVTIGAAQGTAGDVTASLTLTLCVTASGMASGDRRIREGVELRRRRT
jgi:hypothetical protein